MNKNKTIKNRLSKSQSPYLLQHASNPVDWFPWSDDAFKIAKDQNIPRDLSRLFDHSQHKHRHHVALVAKPAPVSTCSVNPWSELVHVYFCHTSTFI